MSAAVTNYLGWASFGLSVIAIVIGPLAWRGIRAEMKDLINDHNEHMHAHPNLAIVARFEERMERFEAKLDRILESLSR